MQLPLTREQEEQLAEFARHEGMTAEELARGLVERYIAEEVRIRAGVQAGLDSAERGELLTSAEVWASIERVLKG
jgi:predicted transcriptional regulator